MSTELLVLECVGDIVLATGYWDCECDDDYIHRHSEKNECTYCGAKSKDSPDSRAVEVIQMMEGKLGTEEIGQSSKPQADEQAKVLEAEE